MDRILKVFLKFLCKLRFTRGFIHYFRRWALLLAFLGRKFGVWHPCNNGKWDSVTPRKCERADCSLGGTGTQFDSRKWAAAASCIPVSVRRSRPRHVSYATHPPPALPTPEHLTAAPHPGYAGYPSRSPSPREQLLPSIPPSNPEYRRRQSSNVAGAVAIVGPSTGSLTLIPLTNPPPEDPSSAGSSTAHLSLTSGAPHLQSPQLSTGAASTLPSSDPPGRCSVKPMNPDQVPRYTRKSTVQVDIITPPKPVLMSVVRPRKRNDFKIPPLTTTFRPEQGQEDDGAPWVSATHPDGALYFYDPAKVRALAPYAYPIVTDTRLTQLKRLFTDTDMHDPVLRDEIAASYDYLQNILLAKGPPPKNYDLVLNKHKEDGQTQWFYYYAYPETRCLFWLETYDAKDMLYEVYGVESPAHVKHRLEALYWSHWSLYPAFFEGRCLEPEIYDELVGILSHGCMDTMTSKSSTLPYDDGTMKKMLELVRIVKESNSNSNSMYHTAAVTRLLSFFGKSQNNYTHWRFLCFHGQKNARLGKHQTVYCDLKRERSIFIMLLSPVLFLAPEVHLREIEKLWTDEIIIDTAWKSFIPKLLEEWQELMLLSTVMLSANVGFLAIPGVVVNITTPAQIASYMSMEASVGSIVIGLLLVRHNRSRQKEDPAGAATYLTQYTHKRFGLEPMAILYSLPWALLMWAMVMFFIALLLVFFRSSDLSMQIFAVTTSAIMAVPIWWCILWSWRSGDSGKQWFSSLPSLIRRMLSVPHDIHVQITHLIPHRARQSSPA
ncbi:hypothetical protein EDB86DRAFT_2826628 [Lactarius hatsudake]|nr:hypothetical protein EDB86DRAFT_2826628 [Lactarius hatsudake]